MGELRNLLDNNTIHDLIMQGKYFYHCFSFKPKKGDTLYFKKVQIEGELYFQISIFKSLEYKLNIADHCFANRVNIFLGYNKGGYRNVTIHDIKKTGNIDVKYITKHIEELSNNIKVLQEENFKLYSKMIK